jgi:hypothetical protein
MPLPPSMLLSTIVGLPGPSEVPSWGVTHACIEIVTAARRKPDIEADCLAAVEIRNRFGERRDRCGENREQGPGETAGKDAHRIALRVHAPIGRAFVGAGFNPF